VSPKPPVAVAAAATDPARASRAHAALADRAIPAAVHLHPGRERPLLQRHPWVMSGSVASVAGDPAPGDEVRVLSARDELLAVGDYDPASQIRVRVSGFAAGRADRASAPERAPALETGGADAWMADRLAAAVTWRRTHPLLQDTDALRLANAEGDSLPGLVIDAYGPWLVLRAGTPAMLRRAERAAQILADVAGSRGGWIRGDVRGAAAVDRAVLGEMPDAPIEIVERGRRYWVDLRHGQKTGFYLDQRDARDCVTRLSPGARVLDLYAYTGGFSTAAAAGGAREIVAVESSPGACELLRRNAPEAEVVEGDVGDFLARDKRAYDVIVVDPPPFARRQRDVTAASRAYRELNRRALARAAPGAHMLTFSCSHHVDATHLRHAATTAALDVGRAVQLIETLSAPPDHPVLLSHPQGAYLSGLLLRVVE
jgi:23S rRNA (cytosine1962-C5)-methyltransferase